MARSKKSENGSESKGSEMKRTTYKEVVNFLSDGSHVGQVELRSYGEGPIVGLTNAIEKHLEQNPGFELDMESITPYGAEISKGNVRHFVSVVWADTQCPRCGAPRGSEHQWCDACTGNVAIDLDAQLADLKAAFSS